MKSHFGELIRELRGKKHLFLRQVAPLLDMDTAQLSKIEKGLRQLKREQIPILAEILNVEADTLLTIWIADQIIDVTMGEEVALAALKVAEQEIISNRMKKVK